MSYPFSPEALAAQAQQKLLQKKRKKKAPKRPNHQPKTSPSQQKGHQYEQLAADYLRQQGLVVLAQNISSPFGEIDIVARWQHSIVFVEVRHRKNTNFGGAIYSVQQQKQQRIKRTAQAILAQITQLYFNGTTPFCRFDVIAIEGEHIHWVTDAFR